MLFLFIYVLFIYILFDCYLLVLAYLLNTYLFIHSIFTNCHLFPAVFNLIKLTSKEVSISQSSHRRYIRVSFWGVLKTCNASDYTLTANNSSIRARNVSRARACTRKCVHTWTSAAEEWTFSRITYAN